MNWNPGNLEITKYLIEHGANIEAIDNEGKTPLILSSFNGKMEVTKYLVEKGANLEAKKNNGWTPLISSSFNGNLEY